MLKYCNKCILPSTRPNLSINKDGICSACLQTQKLGSYDWSNKERKFVKLIKKIRNNNKSSWDCVIPVSGGKDSTWQVLKCLEFDLKPLCVTWKTPSRNKLGQKNLDNLINLGVDHIDLNINPKVQRDFTLKAFKKFGTPAIPMHMAIFAIPINIALKFSIPLIVWGENSAVRYGKKSKLMNELFMTYEWLIKYGVTNETQAEDWFDKTLNEKNMFFYKWPSKIEFENNNIRSIFLGEFFNWDPMKTFEEAKINGFKSDKKPKTGYYKFADIDDDYIITIHHWIKWHKYGFTRLWDNLSLEIRHNRLNRDNAIKIIEQVGDETPVLEIKKFCKYVNISSEEFYSICNKFRNLNVWKKENGFWKIENFLIENWEWK